MSLAQISSEAALLTCVAHTHTPLPLCFAEVINGFYMNMRSKFTAPGTSIYYYEAPTMS